MKDISEFSINKHLKDGHESICRDCMAEKTREYRIKNRDRINRRAKKYRDNYNIWR
jgi:hypothetical protein